MHAMDRVANLLGATALAVTDMMVAGATRAAGVSASGAAALLALRDTAGVGVTDLGRRVGLGQSAAARMVDSLAASGLVQRHGTAGRSVLVRLTGVGAKTADRLLAARGEPLAALLADLGDADRTALAVLLESLLARLYERAGDAERVCRLCDRSACTADATCPVGEAARKAGADGGSGHAEPPDVR